MSGPVGLPDYLDPDIKVLWSLQVLSTVSLTPQNVGLIVKANPPNIRKLGIWFLDESKSEVADVLRSLMHLSHLQTLKIINCSEHPGLPIQFPSNITKITLSRSEHRSRWQHEIAGGTYRSSDTETKKLLAF
jgi:hypothetical protein